MFETFWYFGAERQRIFEARLAGKPQPWTADPILAEYRFCNAFRASDRVSQDLIQVAYSAADSDADDLFARVVVHRLFSRPETWAFLDASVEGLNARTFDVERLGRLLDDRAAAGHRLYTGAFILSASPSYGHRKKHWNHLQLVDAMLKQRVPSRLIAAPSLQSVFEELLSWPLIGPFMAYQLATDLNYTELIDFDENDFTVPGPGALRGLDKVFVDRGNLSPQDAIHWLVDYQACVEDEYGIEPPTLFGRPLHAIDCQNLLCEVDKYCRVAFPALRSNRTRIKQRFAPDLKPLALFYPPKWNVRPSLDGARGRPFVAEEGACP